MNLQIGKYKYPGTGWYVLHNGNTCASGTLRECKLFIKHQGSA